MSRARELDAVVLRGVRFGEADRVLTVLSAQEGHLAVFARGVRRARSRLAGRLEPLGRVRLEVASGRGLPTVTGAELLAGHAGLRTSAGALEAAGRAALSVDRLLADAGPVPAAHGLLCTWLDLLARSAAAADQPTWTPPGAQQVGFALKLLTALGLQPELERCAACGAAEAGAGFDPAHGGVVCAGCGAGARAFGPAARALAAGILAGPLRDQGEGEPRAVAELDRAVRELAEHHLGARLPGPVRAPAAVGAPTPRSAAGDPARIGS